MDDTQTVTSISQPKRKRTWLLLASVAAVAAVASLAAVWAFTRQPGTPAAQATTASPITVRGTVSVPALMVVITNRMKDGDACDLGDLYRDEVRPGAQVVVADPSGKTIGVGQLQRGQIEGAHCALPFDVQLPAGQQFYAFTVARRGTVQFAESQLAGDVRIEIAKDGTARVKTT